MEKTKSRTFNKGVLVAFVVFALVLIVGGGFTAYKLLFDKSEEPSDSAIAEIEGIDTTGETINQIDEEDALIDLIEETQLYVAHCAPVKESEVVRIKDDSSFYIYLRAQDTFSLKLDGYDNNEKVAVEEMYIFGPNESGDSILARVKGESLWNCYGLPVPIEEQVYELVFDSEYNQVLEDFALTISELGAEVSYNAEICTEADHMGSGQAAEVPQGESMSGDVDEGESYYRIDCSVDGVSGNAKILINPVITGGGFGFDMLNEASAANDGSIEDKLQQSTETVKVLGQEFTKTIKQVEINDTIYMEVYYSNIENSLVAEIEGKQVILGYEIAYPVAVEESGGDIQEELDSLITSMTYKDI